jgi:predicted alpha/beta hydrolase
MAVPAAESAAAALPIRFAALDGAELGGVLFAPAGSAPVTHVALINCGGGIPAAHYRGFARYLADNGIPVLTYDYRGIGRSRPQRMRAFKAVVEDWSEWDCAGAIAELRRRYPAAEFIGIGHSVGTMMFGGASNVAEIQRFVFVGAHTGFVGDYRRGFRVPMAVLWHGVMPVVTRIVGFFPGRLLHLGDDIPAGVALQWAGRRTAQLGREAALVDGTRATRLVRSFDRAAGDTLVISVADDAFATEAGTRRLLAMYPRLRPSFERVRPAEAGTPKLGHFGFFRAATGRKLWPRVLAYILHQPPAQVADEASAAHRDVGRPPSAARIHDPESHEPAVHDADHRPD